MPSVTVGSILSTTVGTYVNEFPYVLTGTVGVGDVSGSTLYLGASASTTSGSYIDYRVSTLRYSPPQYYWFVTAYNGATKRATISWDTAPSVGDSWYLIIDYPLQRDYQWYRDGVEIPNAIHTMYTAQSADIGKDLTVKETVWKISSANNGRTYEGPVAPTVTISSPVTVTGLAPSSALVYQDNVSYVGSFALPSSIAGSDTRFGVTNAGIVPAAYSVSGSSSIAVTYYQNLGYGPEFIGMAELEIPATLSTASSFAALPVAVVRRSSSDVYGGQGNLTSSNSTASGLVSGTDMRSNGIFNLHGSSNALISQTGVYTQERNGYFWRRNINVTSGSVEGPFSVIDPVRGQVNARTNSGFMTKVPASWQSALGGDVIAGNGAISVVGAASDGPSAICFNSANITSTVAKVETGVAQGGTGGASATIQLAASANGTTDYYKNFWVFAPNAYAGALRITGYNGSTKVATIDTTIATWTTVPTSSTTYKLIPYISGNQLIQYDIGQLDPNSANADAFCPIWHGGTFASAMFWPNGTDSLVFVGENGGNFYQYGIKNWNTYGGLLGVGGSIRRLYNFTHPSFDGPAPLNAFSPNGDGIKFWMYSAADLAAVVSGSLTYSTIKPRAAWSFRLPNYTSYTGLGQEAPICCYDQSTSKLYVINFIMQDSADPSPTPLGRAVHVFQINNATNL
jgi:hypothetical protein